MAHMKKILLVDDDEDLRDALAEQLRITEEFSVEEAGDGAIVFNTAIPQAK